MYKPLDDATIKEIETIVGTENVLMDREKMEDYSHDEYALDTFKTYPEIVVKPGTTSEIARIVQIANQRHFAVVARGGATGLCGGSVPIFNGVVVSLERMNRILEIDTENLMVTAEAGLTLRDFYAALKERRLFFPPHPGEESATLGGIIATNAGGARAVKYGTVRSFVRGIEAVLADSSVIEAGGKLIKDSTGYSMLHLLTGSEGTLGIITRAVISVMPKPEMTTTIIIPYETLGMALSSVTPILCGGIQPLAIEFISKKIIKISEDYLGKSWPVKPGEVYLMVILEGDEAFLAKTSEKLAEICLERGAIDIFVAQAQEKQDEILHLRSMVYEALKANTIEILDITLPRTEMEPHIATIDGISKEYGVWLPTYGHAGDGNLHTHIMKIAPDGTCIADWQKIYPVVRRQIHEDAFKRKGKISGEHGIGLIKKEYIEQSIGSPMLNAMRRIKKALDPNNILNPGKIFDM